MMQHLIWEIRKSLRMWHWQILLLLTALVSFSKLHFFSANAYTERLIHLADPKFLNPYYTYFRGFFTILGVGYPFLIGLLCYSTLVLAEEKHGMWNFHALRSYYLKLHFAKLVSILLFICCFLGVTMLVTALAIKPEFSSLPNGTLPVHLLEECFFFSKFALCSLGLGCFQYLLILFWPWKQLRVLAGLTGPYLLWLLIPQIISPFSFIYNTDAQISALRKTAALDSDYNIQSLQFFGHWELVSVLWILISIISIYFLAPRFKYLFV